MAMEDDGNGETRTKEQSSSVSVSGADGEKSPRHVRLPLYTERQPPLVQPLETSAFAKRTFDKFGVRDLGHDWVTLFQTIGEGNCGGYSKSMKLNIPDTILLSPSGLPSMWYSTSASLHIKPRNLMRITSQSILEALISVNGDSGLGEQLEKGVVAVRRVGFQVESLTVRQLKECCHEMEHPSVVVHRQEWENEDFACNDQDRDSLLHQPRAFCLQRHIEHACNVSFLALWRCKHREKDPRVSRDNVTDSQYSRSFYKRPLPLLTSDIASKCDLFLVSKSNPQTKRSGESKSVNARTAEEDNDVKFGFDDEPQAAKDIGKPTVLLTYLDLESVTFFEDTLRAFGLEEDVILPQLCHMKLMASEILNRLNRGLQASQASGILCEFFVGARDKKVYFSGLVGTHWEGSEPSWAKLSHIDAISRAVTEYLATNKRTKRRNKTMAALVTSTKSPNWATLSKSTSFEASAMSQSAHHGQVSERSLEIEADYAALRLYNELNPRFPSVESPCVSEQQWHFQSPLLPPDISPRYIGAQVPKSYRNGKFHPLLTSKQADSVNRLNLSPRPPVPLHVPPRGSLSKQYAKLEQLGSGGSAAVTNGARRPTLASPRKLSSAIQPLVAPVGMPANSS